jgi:predicted metallo-beta-lactamase superfamily hydrolase
MEMIAKEVETLVIDHHLLRDEGWYKFLEPVRKSAEKIGHRVITAAELARKEPKPLECRRKELYEEEKPSAEFLKWAKLPKEKLIETAPPL